MSHIDLPQSPTTSKADMLPGSWCIQPYAEDFRLITVKCPECQRCNTLSIIAPGGEFVRGHPIDAEGKASPSLQCPYSGCPWHVYVRLVGWVP